MKQYLRTWSVLFFNEIRIELRSRELVYTSLLFAALLVLLFSFSFLGFLQPTLELQAGILWVALVVSGTLCVARASAREREADTLMALQLTPIPRVLIYLSKCIFVFVILSVTLLVIVLLMLLFFGMSITKIFVFVSLLFGGALGFSALACLFGLAGTQSRKEHTLLPLLIYPLLIPLVLAGVRGTCETLYANHADALRWLRFLWIFDAIVLTASAWLFEPLCTKE